MHQLSMTVGIPTYYGGQGVVETAKSISASQGVADFRFIVTVDGNPLQKEVKKQLLDLGVEVIENKQRGGQVARIKQLIELCETDILVLTQDDIVFGKDTLSKIAKAFAKNPKITMVGARMLPVPAKILLEKVVERGVYLTHRIGDMYQNGDNYLLSSGRCLAFRSEFIKQMDIPEEIINSDAYLYFENKRKNGKFLALKNAFVYNKSPQKIVEHIKQSKKFAYSRGELHKYLPEMDFEVEYKIPKWITVKALTMELVSHPIWTMMYVGLQVYVRFQKNPFVNIKRFWDTDVSTKRV
jgi:cellulose synthase/poly-beta-1,6-N-acetylglucosamine synthase-like glycosyltransferase